MFPACDRNVVVFTSAGPVGWLWMLLLLLLDMSSWIERVEGILTALLTFCQRNSSKLDSKDKARQVMSRVPPATLKMPGLVKRFSKFVRSPLSPQVLWFPTFDRVHDLQRKYKECRNQRLVERESNSSLRTALLPPTLYVTV